MWDHIVIDATMGLPLCFCPVELDADGHIESVVTGMNFVGAPPARGRVIGIIHEDGQEAVESFYAANRELIEPYILAPR